MPYQNERGLSHAQIHLLRSILDGKREISEREAMERAANLSLRQLAVPCAVVCVSPFFSQVAFTSKDEVIQNYSDYICAFLQKEAYQYYCLLNSYDNFQIILPTTANDLSEQDLDELFIRMRQELFRRFYMDLFIGIGSVVERVTEITCSAQEAMEMLAFKNQYADRGVINIINTSRFKHYSLYGEDIMFARVLGRFQDGDLGMMSSRLDELASSILKRPGISQTAIRRTFVELAVNILHIASNANVDVDAILGDIDIYNWIMQQTELAVLKEWLLDLSAKLLKSMDSKKADEEKSVILQACDYISAHLSDPGLSLQAVSGAVGLSGAYFSQLFKAEKGLGLSVYIAECRVRLAQQMLLNTDLKNEDIARQTGFASATYFSRVFKNSTGMTPSDYRKTQIKTL